MDPQVEQACQELDDVVTKLQQALKFTDEQMARVLQIIAIKLNERAAKG